MLGKSMDLMLEHQTQENNVPLSVPAFKYSKILIIDRTKIKVFEIFIPSEQLYFNPCIIGKAEDARCLDYAKNSLKGSVYHPITLIHLNNEFVERLRQWFSQSVVPIRDKEFDSLVERPKRIGKTIMRDNFSLFYADRGNELLGKIFTNYILEDNLPKEISLETVLEKAKYLTKEEKNSLLLNIQFNTPTENDFLWLKEIHHKEIERKSFQYLIFGYFFIIMGNFLAKIDPEVFVLSLIAYAAIMNIGAEVMQTVGKEYYEEMEERYQTVVSKLGSQSDSAALSIVIT